MLRPGLLNGIARRLCAAFNTSNRCRRRCLETFCLNAFSAIVPLRSHHDNTCADDTQQEETARADTIEPQLVKQSMYNMGHFQVLGGSRRS